MPDYYINGRKYRSDTPLNDDELEELAEPASINEAPVQKNLYGPNPTEKSTFEKVYDTATTTPEPIRRFMRSVGERIAPSNEDINRSSLLPPGTPDVGMYLRSFLAGAIGGHGNIGTPEESSGLSSFFNPLDVTDLALTGGAYGAARRGLGTAAKALTYGSRALAAPVAVHGAQRIADPESPLSDRFVGAAELAGGLLGVRQPVPSIRPPRNAPPINPAGAPPTGPPNVSVTDLGPTPPRQKLLTAPDPSTMPMGGPVQTPPYRPQGQIEGPSSLNVDPNRFDPNTGLPLNEPVPPADLFTPRPELERQETDIDRLIRSVTEQQQPQSQVMPPAPTMPQAGQMDDINQAILNAQANRPVRPRGTKDEWDIDWPPTEAEQAVRTPEVLPAETELDLFGYPKNRDLTPEEVAEIKERYREPFLNSFGEDTVEGQAAWDELDGTINTMSKETEQIVNEIIQANNEGYAVYPKGYKGPIPTKIIRTLSDGSRVVDPRSPHFDQNTQVPEFEIVDEFGPNASGESAASQEAINRAMNMRGRGEQFVVYDRAGNKRPLIGPEAVDYTARQGETYGVERQGQFQPLDDKGGKWQSNEPDDIAFSQAPPERNWPSDRWEAIVNELDAENAPDHKYRDILSTGGKDKLKKGETWRGRVLKYIEMDRARRNEPQGISEMRVPGTENPQTGLPNVAMGGADAPVLKTLGSSLYTKDRPTTIVKEVIQNTLDEMKISGRTGPIRVLFDYKNTHPITGKPARSIAIRDSGRGITPNEIYTVFSNVSASGKRNIAEASGGFGFAKAAPFLGGDYMRVRSVVDEGGDRVAYVFEGTPDQFLNQQVGVPVERFLSPGEDTGLSVEVLFPEDKHFDQAEGLLKELVEQTPHAKNINFYENHTSDTTYGKDFLKTGKTPSHLSPPKLLEGKPLPPKVTTINTPTVAADVHFKNDNIERKKGTLVFLNNGIFVKTQGLEYGQSPRVGVPEKIIVDIRSKVEEGEEGYPFGLNREDLDQNLTREINNWIHKNIADVAEKERIKELQGIFDSIQPAVKGHRHVILDSGDRYTPAEKANVINSPALTRIARTFESLINDLTSAFPSTSGQTKKFGYHIGKPEQGGLNIPSPISREGNAILINPFSALSKTSNPAEAARRLVHIMVHEFNHNIARSEGSRFTWSLAEMYEKFPLERQLQYARAIEGTISNRSGGYTPEVQKLLSEYTTSRGRPESTPDLLARERESEWLRKPGQRGISGSNQPDGKGTSFWERMKSERGEMNIEHDNSAFGKKVDMEKDSVVKELFNLPRGLMSVDAPFVTSAMFRQGMPLAGNEHWIKAWAEAAKSYKSEDLYRHGIKKIQEHQFFTPRIKLDKNFRPRRDKKGNLLPRQSWAEEMGLELTDLTNINTREETIRSTWAEKMPYKWGKLIRRSNRAYVGALNYMRANLFIDLVTDSAMEGLGGRKNEVLSKEIAKFINIATGRGKLEIGVAWPTGVGERNIAALGEPKHKFAGLNWNSYTRNFESSATVLIEGFFSPRLIARNIAFLNPATYIMADPFIRKQYLWAYLRWAGTWGSMVSAALASGIAEVSFDPNSADFGKIRIGNTRFDPGGGLLQHIVQFNRMLPATGLRDIHPILGGGGGITSTTTGKFKPFGTAPFPQTRWSTTERFLANKSQPVVKYGYDAWNAEENVPMYMGDRVLQLFLPMVTGDLAEVMKKDPKVASILLDPASLAKGAAVLGASSIGMGAQTYEPNEPIGKPVITPFFGVEDYDIKYKGH